LTMSKRRPESGIVVIWVLLALALSACTRQSQPTQAEPVRVSGVDVDAAEPAMGAAPDGSVYLGGLRHSHVVHVVNPEVAKALLGLGTKVQIHFSFGGCRECESGISGAFGCALVQNRHRPYEIRSLRAANEVARNYSSSFAARRLRLTLFHRTDLNIHKLPFVVFAALIADLYRAVTVLTSGGADDNRRGVQKTR